VRRLTIGNVARRGALSPTSWRRLVTEVVAAAADIGCLVLTGTGTTFCAGHDLENWTCRRNRTTPKRQ
jgi:enoyl-CoA hydratase/carnithine racemase